jgi:uncharacterized protein YecT (DUF1311 family)
MKKFNILLSLSIYISCASYAQAPKTIESCEGKTADKYKISQCIEELKKSTERELTPWVNNQVFTLETMAKQTGRSTLLNQFKKSQKDFEKYRASNCRWLYLMVSPGAKAPTEYNKCVIELNKNRIKQLQKAAK